MVIFVLGIASLAHAGQPATQPAPAAKRPAMLSIKEAESALGLMGLVRDASFRQTFAPHTSDPHQQFRDRYMYGASTCYPCFYGGWYGYCGYGCGYGCGFGSNGCPSIVTPGVFYGD